MNAPGVARIEVTDRYQLERLIYPGASPSVLTEEGMNELAKINTASFHYARLGAIASDKFEDEKLLERLEKLVPVLKSQISAKEKLIIGYKSWIMEEGYVREVPCVAVQSE